MARSVFSRALVFGLCLWLTVVGEAAASPGAYENSANDALLTLLEMQRLNTRFHLKAATLDFARARRTWLWDAGNAVATEGGLIAATALFFKHSEDKNRLSPELRRSGNRWIVTSKLRHVHNRASGTAVAGTIEPQIAGQAIGGLGALYELKNDIARSKKIRREKLDRIAVMRQMVKLNADLEARLQNMTLVGAEDIQCANELKLLQAIRRRTLLEFMRLEGQSGNIAVGRYIEDGVSLMRNSVGLVGNSINVAGVVRNDKNENGDGTILNLVAASLIAVRPFLTNAAASFVARRNKKDTARYFADLVAGNPDMQPKEDLRLLLSMLSNESSFVLRKTIYAEDLDKLEDEENLAEFEARSFKQKAVRRYRESIYGPTKQAQSILGLVVAFRGGNNATTDNRISAAGNTVYTSGQAINILELLRERVVDEQQHRHLALDSMLPEQRMARHIVQLDRMQLLLKK